MLAASCGDWRIIVTFARNHLGCAYARLFLFRGLYIHDHFQATSVTRKIWNIWWINVIWHTRTIIWPSQKCWLWLGMKRSTEKAKQSEFFFHCLSYPPLFYTIIHWSVILNKSLSFALSAYGTTAFASHLCRPIKPMNVSRPKSTAAINHAGYDNLLITKQGCIFWWKLVHRAHYT